MASQLREIRRGKEKWLLLLANGVNHVDLDGAAWIAEEARYWREKKRGGIIIVRLKLVAQDVMKDGGYLDKIGLEYFFNTKTEAFRFLYSQLDRSICKDCTRRIFIECENDKSLPPVPLVQ